MNRRQLLGSSAIWLLLSSSAVRAAVVKGGIPWKPGAADPPNAVTLAGSADGALGFGHGEGRITLRPTENGTTIHYVYEAGIGGKVASIGGRLLDGAARVIIGQFFASLARHAGGGSAKGSLLGRFRQWFGGSR